MVDAQKTLLNTLVGKAEMLAENPSAGVPVAAVLRQLEGVVDVRVPVTPEVGRRLTLT